MKNRLPSYGAWFPMVIAVAGTAVYLNSFSVPFIYDAKPFIEHNVHIQKPWPLWNITYDTSRPLTYLSFALNYAAGGLHPWGYHAVNLAIHLLAGLILYGLVRRSLQQPVCAARYGAVASEVALVTALLWVVHPLQTEAVVYLYQRAEALMGLWYLLTLYCVLRSARATQPSRWQTAAIVSCALGMASKPIMVTAPLMVLLYDRVFLAGSVRRAWQQRRGLYLGLLATWGLLVLILAGPASDREGTGFNIYYARNITPLAYLCSQPGVVLHYLRLAFWPAPLVFDYGWPIATMPHQMIPQSLTLGLLLVLCGVAWRRCRPLGFLGVACVLFLIPTSTIIPSVALAVEHRMYVPLAAVLLLGVLGGDYVLRRSFSSGFQRRMAAMTLGGTTILAFGMMTIRRNADYRSEEAIWRDTIAKRPANAFAWCALGNAIGTPGRFDESLTCYQTALRLKPNATEAIYNASVTLARRKRYQEAVEELKATLTLWPGPVPAASAREGLALATAGNYGAAIAAYESALALNPDDANSQYNLAVILFLRGDRTRAVRYFADVLIWTRENASRRAQLGLLLGRLELLDDVMSAIRHAGGG